MSARVQRARAVGDIAVADSVGSNVTTVPMTVSHAKPQIMPREWAPTRREYSPTPLPLRMTSTTEAIMNTAAAI